MSARVTEWLAAPKPADVTRALARLSEAPDVARIAVMPDVHLAADVCVGTVLATRRLIYPAAVGGDIGCGVAAVGFDAGADALTVARAPALFAGLARAAPPRRQRVAEVLPDGLEDGPLSHPRLDALRRRDGRLELGTLGSGNHFVELQRDEDGRLWLMLHSGSRGLGQAIRDHHVEPRLAALEDAEAYLGDAAWAVRYAATSRRLMVERVAALCAEVLGARADFTTFVDADHNHVRREVHDGEELWVHRKGAMHAAAGARGLIPGSMGAWSYHVEGRGEPAALCSSSHGAGRAMARGEARRAIPPAELRRQMRGVLYDPRLERALCDEAPGAYKDITAVMRAQRDLVKIVRKVTPLLSYKGP